MAALQWFWGGKSLRSSSRCARARHGHKLRRWRNGHLPQSVGRLVTGSAAESGSYNAVTIAAVQAAHPVTCD
jgi:hypothetical protein